ncbi:hypothetical protein [Caulobacter sp. Root655]|uniref:hypothetical protein n=1 Tax=Caulobacter sp. Root655 TaxID=1736578 RepID=UPI0012E3AFCE|nr:hypothetical protein [Caulobacter sp. Root655]
MIHGAEHASPLFRQDMDAARAKAPKSPQRLEISPTTRGVTLSSVLLFCGALADSTALKPG